MHTFSNFDENFRQDGLLGLRQDGLLGLRRMCGARRLRRVRVAETLKREQEKGPERAFRFQVFAQITYLFFNSQNNEKLIFLLNFRVKIIVKRIKNIIKSCWPKKQFVKEDISRRRKVSKGKCKFMLVSVLQISPLFVYLCTLVDVGFISNTGLVEPYHRFFFTLYSSFSFELTFKSQ